MGKRRAAQTAQMSGQLIRLRPFAPGEVDAAWQGLAAQDELAHPRTSPRDWRAEPTPGFHARIERSGRLWRGCLDLAVDRRGRLVGLVQARTRPKQTLPQGVFEIGIVLFRSQDRGKGYGREAVALLTAWLFEIAGAERVQAGTEVTNSAMRAVLKRLGFRLEGVMRGYGVREDGTRADGAMYAMLRPEWNQKMLSKPL